MLLRKIIRTAVDKSASTNDRGFSIGSVALTIGARFAAAALIEKLKGERS